MERSTESRYSSCLDDLYSSFMRVKHLVKGKHDSEVRQPQRIIEIIEELKLLPPKDRLIRITGSKGKGTVSRLISRYLKAVDEKAKVGLIVSPEEIDHVDRMQINGVAISYEDFIRIYEELQPILRSKQTQLHGIEYLSPFGIFLIIALKWFSEENVTDFVIEGGRGVLFDEAGQLNSKVSVVTSILLEHPTYIGPTLEDIAKDKLSIRHSSDVTVIDPSSSEWHEKLYSSEDKSNIYEVSLPEVKSPFKTLLKPKWFFLDQEIAKVAIEIYEGCRIDAGRLMDNYSINHSPSFGFCKAFGLDFYYEALITADSIDEMFWLQLLKKYSNKIMFLASLPDDKDLDEIHTLVRRLGGNIKHIALGGTRGYLSYTKTLTYYTDDLAGVISVDLPEDLRKLIQSIADSPDVLAVYALGTQTYIRSVKYALNTSRGNL